MTMWTHAFHYTLNNLPEDADWFKKWSKGEHVSVAFPTRSALTASTRSHCRAFRRVPTRFSSHISRRLLLFHDFIAWITWNCKILEYLYHCMLFPVKLQNFFCVFGSYVSPDNTFSVALFFKNLWTRFYCSISTYYITVGMRRYNKIIFLLLHHFVLVTQLRFRHFSA